MLPDYVLSPLILQWIIWPIVRPLFWSFGSFEVRGLENLRDLPKGVIFASNHTSELDAILIPAALPFFSRFRPFFYTSREQSFYDGTGWRQRFYGGLLFKMLGAYPVQAGKQNYELSLATHISIARKKQSVIIFPEGKVGTADAFLPARGGVAYLSEATGAPIVPLLISGTYGISFLSFFSRKRQIVLSFGKPIHAKQLFLEADAVLSAENRYKSAGERIMQSIRALQRENYVSKEDVALASHKKRTAA